MISNPGVSSSVDTSSLMVKSTYDSQNKNTDVFKYADSLVSDKVTSSQVDSKISTATANFITSSQVDSKISSATSSFATQAYVSNYVNDNISSKKPYDWSYVTIVPYSSTLTTISVNSYKRKALPVPIYIGTYEYELVLEYVGMGYSDGTQNVSATNRSVTGSLALATSSSSSGTHIAFTSIETTAAINNVTVTMPVELHYILPKSGAGCMWGWGFGIYNWSAANKYFGISMPSNTTALSSGTYNYVRLSNDSGNKSIVTYGMKLRYRAISA